MSVWVRRAAGLLALVTAVVSTGPAAGNASAGGNARPAGAPALSDLLLKGSQVHGLGYARGRPLQIKVTAEDIALCRVMGTPGQVEAVLDLNRAVLNPGGVQTSDDVIELLLQTATPKEAAATLARLGSYISRCTHDPLEGGTVGPKRLHVARSTGSPVRGADLPTKFTATVNVTAQLSDGTSTARLSPTLLAWRVGSRVVILLPNHQTHVGRHETDGDAPAIHADALKLATAAVHDARSK